MEKKTQFNLAYLIFALLATRKLAELLRTGKTADKGKLGENWGQETEKLGTGNWGQTTIFATRKTWSVPYFIPYFINRGQTTIF